MGGSSGGPRERAQVTVRDAIGDLPWIHVSPDAALGAQAMEYGESTAGVVENGSETTRTVEMDVGDVGARSTSDFVERAREGCTGDNARIVYDHSTRSVRADDFEAFQLMDGRTMYSDLPKSLKRYRDDIFEDKYNRLAWDEPSRTITAHLAKDGYWYIHPEQHRTLTVREAARLQTFPDIFRFAGHRSHQFKQIGNAVPPALARQIGSAILSSIEGQEDHQNGSSLQTMSESRRRRFRESIVRWANHIDAEGIGR